MHTKGSVGRNGRCIAALRGRKGGVVFNSDENGPWPVRVGARDGYIAIEYGLVGMQIGGERTIVVPPNRIYHERKTYEDIPKDAMLVYDISLVDFLMKWDPEMESRLSNSTNEQIV